MAESPDHRQMGETQIRQPRKDQHRTFGLVIAAYPRRSSPRFHSSWCRSATPGLHERRELGDAGAERAGLPHDYPGDGWVASCPCACGAGAGEEVDVAAAAVCGVTALAAGSGEHNRRLRV